MAILLRTLARKSVLDFGKYEGRSVQQVIDLKNTRMLRWYYYNCSMISFLPDILDELGITEEWRIPKPGKDPEKGKALDKKKDQRIAEFRKRAYEEKNAEELCNIARHKAKEKKMRHAKLNDFLRDDSVEFSKGNMAWKNQGH